MNPGDIANYLRRIASKIENSESPPKHLVVADIKRVIAQMSEEQAPLSPEDIKEIGSKFKKSEQPDMSGPEHEEIYENPPITRKELSEMNAPKTQQLISQPPSDTDNYDPVYPEGEV